jgi:hypothetical protein
MRTVQMIFERNNVATILFCLHKLGFPWGMRLRILLRIFRILLRILRLNIDEVVPWEVKNLYNLMNAIFSEAIDNQVNKLRKEKCCGCIVDHPSQKIHECLMMSED